MRTKKEVLDYLLKYNYSPVSSPEAIPGKKWCYFCESPKCVFISHQKSNILQRVIVDLLRELEEDGSRHS